MSADRSTRHLLDLLARWQAFSELQQRAFAFLAAEALTSGQEFEDSTQGATEVLMRMGASGQDGDLQAQTFSVVERLQAADRSRQGLEQVASVLNTLRAQHADLVEATHAVADLPDVDTMVEEWIYSLSRDLSLADWRRRLDDALRGRPPTKAPPVAVDDELF